MQPLDKTAVLAFFHFATFEGFQAMSTNIANTATHSVATQMLMQFQAPKETQVERCRRILAGTPKVKRASKLFDYDEATQQHQESVSAHGRLDSQPITPER